MTLEKIPSPQFKARIAGILYVYIIIAGIFSEALVRDKVIDWHNAAATAQGIQAAEQLYRIGFATDLVAIMSAIVVSVLFFEILKPVSRTAASLALAFALISNTIEVANALNHFAPLEILEPGPSLSALEPAQRAALTLLSLKLHHTEFMILLAVFGVSCLFYGYLFYRSGFLPRALGVLMTLAGLSYLINSFAIFLAPKFAGELFPYILLPVVVGESAVALWLAIAGVNRDKWLTLAARSA